VSLDRRTIAAIALVGMAIVLVGGGSEIAAQERPDPPDTEYVQLTNDTRMWPYTSATQGHHGRTLAINVIIYGDPARVERHFRERTEGDWNETEANESDVDPVEGPNGTLVAWGSASGAARYLYVEHATLEGGWYDETFQLHDGDYFGSRHHVRAYASPDQEEADDEQWVAIQAHHEHWDWFRLRHTVDGVHQSQVYVEREFMGRWYIGDLSRVHVGNTRGFDTDGWVTVIELGPSSDPVGEEGTAGDAAGGVAAAIVLAIGVPTLRRVNRYLGEQTAMIPERKLRIALLASAVGGLYLTVRFAGLAVERLLPGLHPHAIAAAFYPLLFAGLPLCAAVFSRELDRLRAFVGATLGFTTATFLDYTFLQVTVLPIDTLVHRLALATALGLIAAGAPRSAERAGTDHTYFRLGLLLWLVAFVLPMLRFV
jgi:hypothetical protein